MICLICRQAEIVEGITSIIFQRGEMCSEIRNVPAYVCPSCAEAYVEEAVAARLLQSAQKIYESGSLEAGVEFRAEQI